MSPWLVETKGLETSDEHGDTITLTIVLPFLGCLHGPGIGLGICSTSFNLHSNPIE